MFRNLGIVSRVICIGMVLAALVLICTVKYYLAQTENISMHKEEQEVYVASALALKELYAAGLQSEQATRNVILNPLDEKASSNFKQALDDFDVVYKRLLAINKGRDLAGRLERARPQWDQGVELKRRSCDLAKRGDTVAAVDILVKEETPKWRSFKAEVQALQKELGKQMAGRMQEINERNMAAFHFNLVLLGLTVLLTVGLLLLFAYDLKVRLRHITERLRDMAEGEGDLTQRMDVDSGDELAEIARYFNLSWDKLDRMIGEVIEHATLVGTCAGQVSIQSQRIAKNARDIAVQSVAVATASEEMSATSTDIARNCAMAADSSRSASGVACGGQGVVQQTITRMDSIRSEVESSSQVIQRLGQSSETIGEIAGTIEDIADQTNLLALNAAIEAARAGEQGRGFAVVADEVRALAERTARATKEIGAMIASIQGEAGHAIGAMQRSAGEVDSGVREAGESGAALAEIIGRINEVALQVSQIATAAEEQTATTVEIVGNIGNITETVELFDHSTNDMNGRVQHLLDLSDELKNCVSSFKAHLNPLLILDKAKFDHVMFVGKIEKCISGRETIKPGSLPDNTTCNFGKWYFSEGMELCGKAPSYAAINPPHETLHRTAVEAVECYLRGDVAMAEKKLREVEDLSATIIELLDKVKAECVGSR